MTGKATDRTNQQKFERLLIVIFLSKCLRCVKFVSGGIGVRPTAFQRRARRAIVIDCRACRRQAAARRCWPPHHPAQTA